MSSRLETKIPVESNKIQSEVSESLQLSHQRRMERHQLEGLQDLGDIIFTTNKASLSDYVEFFKSLAVNYGVEELMRATDQLIDKLQVSQEEQNSDNLIDTEDWQGNNWIAFLIFMNTKMNSVQRIIEGNFSEWIKEKDLISSVKSLERLAANELADLKYQRSAGSAVRSKINWYASANPRYGRVKDKKHISGSLSAIYEAVDKHDLAEETALKKLTDVITQLGLSVDQLIDLTANLMEQRSDLMIADHFESIAQIYLSEVRGFKDYGSGEVSADQSSSIPDKMPATDNEMEESAEWEGGISGGSISV